METVEQKLNEILKEVADGLARYQRGGSLEVKWGIIRKHAETALQAIHATRER